MRAWEEFLSQQEKELGHETVSKWLRPLKVVRFDACNLYLEAADSFKIVWFEEHIRPRVRHSLVNNNHKQIKVHIAVAAHEDAKELASKKTKTTNSSSTIPPFTLRFDDIDNEATFEAYTTSQGNLLAYKILCESCGMENQNGKFPPPAFNPIFLFGRSGTGKTHLLMAATLAFQKKGYKALYVRADTFTEHVVNAIRAGEMQTFRKAYRSVDTLLIDDIEVFSRKGATQEELFHTFNTLHVEGKQIILSAGSSPQELKFIEPRLISRFEWGIVIPIQMLDREGLLQILKKRATKLQFALDDSLFNFLIETFGTNTKNLLRALDALVLRSHLNCSTQKLTLKAAEHILSDLIQEEEKAILTPGKIIKTVAEYYGIKMEDILSKSQARECVLPRQIAMHLCRDKLQIPYMKIGDIFGRDHSTVMTSVKQVLKGIEEKNYEISGALKSILKALECQEHPKVIPH